MASHTTTRTQMGVVRLCGWSSDSRCGCMEVHRTSLICCDGVEVRVWVDVCENPIVPYEKNLDVRQRRVRNEGCSDRLNRSC